VLTADTEPSKRFSTKRRDLSGESTRPDGPSPTVTVAWRAPEASKAITLFDPSPAVHVRPSDPAATPRGSPTDCSRLTTLVVGAA